MKDLNSLDGTPVSRLTFGTMQFGGGADDAASAAMFSACIEAGITHFDTALVYTGGASEQILGRLIAPQRERLFIATKAAYDKGASRANILESVDVSRKRLGIDTLDALYMHRFDGTTPLQETFETLAELKQAGTIRHVGISNYAAWQAVNAVWVARGFDLSIDLIQPMYSLVKRQAEVEILPMAAEMNMLCAPYSPLGGGLLTGKYAAGETGRLTTDARYAKRYDFDYMHKAASELATIASEMGVNTATLAVAWAARHPTRPVPIISARSAAQLAPSLAALDFEMDDALYARLCALTPTPPPATDRAEEA